MIYLTEDALKEELAKDIDFVFSKEEIEEFEKIIMQLES